MRFARQRRRVDRAATRLYVARMANVSTGVIGAFAGASAVERRGDGLYAVDVPDGWQQGRGAFGGLVLGTLLRAACAEEPDATRAARALAGDICGPVMPGLAEVAVRVLRRGRNQSNVAAELRQGGEIVALLSAVLAGPRHVDASPIAGLAPRGKPWGDVPPAPIQPPMGPVFAQHYEYRIDGPMPFSSGPEPVAEGWVREKTPGAVLDAPAMIGLLDAWYPAFFSSCDGPRPCATVSFAAQLFAEPASLDPSIPLRYRARVVESRGGYFLETRELWSDAVLVATNQQTFAILK